ncbi:MAG: hypothetical protein WAO58_08340 [Fimbriimonadaceae bacterium]
MRSIRAFTIVSTLITVALILALAVAFMFGTGGGKSSRKDGLGKTVPGAVVLSAKDDVCRSNLDQTRKSMYMLMEGAVEDQMPTLTDTKMPADMVRCVIGNKEAYILDTSTYAQDGDLKKLVRCPHPGHEKY